MKIHFQLKNFTRTGGRRIWRWNLNLIFTTIIGVIRFPFIREKFSCRAVLCAIILPFARNGMISSITPLNGWSCFPHPLLPALPPTHLGEGWSLPFMGAKPVPFFFFFLMGGGGVGGSPFGRKTKVKKFFFEL